MWCVCVCVCGLWSSRASRVVQMWCNKTQCEEHAHLEGSRRHEGRQPGASRSWKDHPGRPRAAIFRSFVLDL